MQTYLITGANRGIGAEMRRQALAAGDRVIATARQLPAQDTDWKVLDVTDPAAHAALARDLADTPIDVLVCNAGVYVDKGKALGEITAEDWHTTLAANVVGPFLTVQALLPNLRLSDRPRVAIMSSQMGSSERAPGGSWCYRASKAAVTNIARNLAADLAPQGIAVGAYHPGWVKTDMGGAAAEISVEESARGLLERFGALSPDNTGAFQTWDGRDHPF